jgi:hypothetical protein
MTPLAFILVAEPADGVRLELTALTQLRVT